MVVPVIDVNRLDEPGVKGNEWHRKRPKHLAIASHILRLRLFLWFPRRPFHFQNGFVNCTNQSFAHERMSIEICLSVNEHVKGERPGMQGRATEGSHTSCGSSRGVPGLIRRRDAELVHPEDASVVLPEARREPRVADLVDRLVQVEAAKHYPDVAITNTSSFLSSRRGEVTPPAGKPAP
jgi:hypothetical protein